MFAILKKLLCKTIWLSALVWLLLEAWLTLDATFHVPFGLADLVRWGHWSPRLLTGLQWFKLHAWPAVSLVVVLVIRQEAHRWFNLRRGQRRADQLITAWFVFVGTLLTVDWLSPDILIRWPVSAIDLTIWLMLMQTVSWMSCLLHPASRRKFNKFIRRWPLVQWLGQVLELRSSPLRNIRKGIGREGPRPHTSNRRQAR